jgi:hypothetical protein
MKYTLKIKISKTSIQIGDQTIEVEIVLPPPSWILLMGEWVCRLVGWSKMVHYQNLTVRAFSS